MAVEAIEAARKELYAAEGSDWFWWYGDDFVTDHKEIFDQLFRLHLGNVFRALNMDVPEFLLQPIWQRQSGRATVQEPVSLIDPCIDGIVTDFYEWRGAGYIDGQPPLSAMYRGPGIFTRVYFGFNLEHFFLRFDPLDVRSCEETPPDDGPPVEADEKTAAPVVQVQFLEPNHLKLVFSLEPSAPERFTLFKSSDGISFFSAATYESIRRRKIIELRAPLKDLGVQLGSTVHLVIKVLTAGLERERLPPYHPLTLRVPDQSFEATMWKA